ncbi:proteasome subunit beta type [Elysia marginata]|uniref:Proteasome subunit beta type n=1 Tax=Elysia marginata TaxID=1093978 RepID=A0AAV4IDS7_9GAST|nr:proteasome subunit beta type [Elysia marginata]
MKQIISDPTHPLNEDFQGRIISRSGRYRIPEIRTERSEKTVLGCCGFHGDVLTLTKILGARLQIFEKDHNKPMPTPSVAAMLSTILYYRRFFPYYTHNLVVGLDEEG